MEKTVNGVGAEPRKKRKLGKGVNFRQRVCKSVLSPSVKKVEGREGKEESDRITISQQHR